MRAFALRLRPGQDPKATLDDFARMNRLRAACVLTCVGSLERAVLRFADRDQAVTVEGRFEIVSLTGVLSEEGGHYHIAISDDEGRTLGAHLMDGSAVFTTAEIVLAELPDLRFLRTFDPATGFPELDVRPSTQG